MSIDYNYEKQNSEKEFKIIEDLSSVLFYLNEVEYDFNYHGEKEFIANDVNYEAFLEKYKFYKWILKNILSIPDDLEEACKYHEDLMYYYESLNEISCYFHDFNFDVNASLGLGIENFNIYNYQEYRELFSDSEVTLKPILEQALIENWGYEKFWNVLNIYKSGLSETIKYKNELFDINGLEENAMDVLVRHNDLFYLYDKKTLLDVKRRLLEKLYLNKYEDVERQNNCLKTVLAINKYKCEKYDKLYFFLFDKRFLIAYNFNRYILFILMEFALGK